MVARTLRLGQLGTALAAVSIGGLVGIGWASGFIASLLALHREPHGGVTESEPLAGVPVSQSPAALPAGPAVIGASETPARLLIPVAGVSADQLVNTFTEARAAGARRHDAIDIMAPLGTPVLAAADGIVERLFLSRDGGNTIYIRSPDRAVIHYYAHLDGYADGLAEGAVVHAGEVIGRVGYSGNANPAAPHLHFAVVQTAPEAKWYEPGLAVNPYPLLRGP